MSKTTWRYCISRSRTPGGDDWYTIRELYEGPDGLSWTEDATPPEGESLSEMVSTLLDMKDAVCRPILDLTLDPPALVEQTLSPG